MMASDAPIPADLSPEAQLLRSILLPAAIALPAAVLAPILLGFTLATPMLLVVVVCLLAPIMAMREPSRLPSLLAAITPAECAGAVLLAFIPADAITLYQWLQVYAMLLCISLALWGITRLLHRIGLPPVAAAAAAITLAGLWLCWPVWLSPTLSGSPILVGLLGDPHPLLALSGALDLGVWLENPFIYRLTNLNQDVPVALPRSTWWACIVHLPLALLAWPAGRYSSRI